VGYCPYEVFERYAGETGNPELNLKALTAKYIGALPIELRPHKVETV
jgi:hypothetical protein